MPDKVGERLVKMGVMRSEQIEEILRLQEAGDERLFGEIAIEKGYLDEEALRKYLEEKEQEAGPIMDLLTH